MNLQAFKELDCALKKKEIEKRRPISLEGDYVVCRQLGSLSKGISVTNAIFYNVSSLSRSLFVCALLCLAATPLPSSACLELIKEREREGGRERASGPTLLPLLRFWLPYFLSGPTAFPPRHFLLSRELGVSKPAESRFVRLSQLYICPSLSLTLFLSLSLFLGLG